MPMDGHHATQTLAMEAAHQLLDRRQVDARLQAEGPRIGFEEGRDSKGKCRRNEHAGLLTDGIGQRLTDARVSRPAEVAMLFRRAEDQQDAVVPPQECLDGLPVRVFEPYGDSPRTPTSEVRRT
jgi:hypothetical protein